MLVHCGRAALCAVLWTALLICAVDDVNAVTAVDAVEDSDPVQLWQTNESSQHPAVLTLAEEGHVDLWGHHGNNHTKFLVREEDVFRVRRSLEEGGVEYSVEVEDVMDLVEREHRHRTTRTKRDLRRMDWDTYHTLGDLEGYIGWLNQSTNGVVQVLPVATSSEGRPVYVVRVNDAGATGPKKRIWIEGGVGARHLKDECESLGSGAGIHAREWISPSVTTFLLHQVATNPDWLRSILPHTEWYFVPVANPDGYLHTFKGGRARLWRKNRRVNDLSLPDRCKGVDLNRNWDLKWGVGASKNPCSELFMGDIPFSEPETDGLKHVMERVGPLDLFITFHSFGQSVLYPWGWTKDPPKNAKMLHRVGRRFLEAVQHVSDGDTEYTLGGSGAMLGYASGATDDWAFGALGAKYAYTIELRDTGHYGFLLPEAQIGTTVREAAAGVQCMVTYMINNGVCARRRRASKLRATPRGNL